MFDPLSSQEKVGLLGLGLGLPCCICTATGLTPATSAPRLGSPPATSAPGLGSPRPHLHRDWAHPAHICTAAGLTPAHICTAAVALVARNVSCGFVSARCRPPPPLRSVLARPSYRHRLWVSRAPVVGAVFFDGLAAGSLRSDVLCTLCCAATCCARCAALQRVVHGPCCTALQRVVLHCNRCCALPLTR